MKDKWKETKDLINLANKQKEIEKQRIQQGDQNSINDISKSLEQDNSVKSILADFKEIPKTEGVKFDSEKCPLHLLPPYALEGTAWVFGCGAEKYAAHNYLNGMAWSKMLRAAESHIAEIKKGNFTDEEFGTQHIYHAICSLLMLAENMIFHPEKNDLVPEAYIIKSEWGKKAMALEKEAALNTIKKFKEKKNVSK